MRMVSCSCVRPGLMDRPWPFDFFCRGTCAITVRQSYPSNPCLGQFCNHIWLIESKREAMKLPVASCGVSQAELRRSQTRFRAKALRLGSPRHPCRAGALAEADHPCSPDLSGSSLRCDKLQGILVKANKPMSTHWETFYAERKTTLEKALQVVKRGSRVFLGTACAEPQYPVQGLIDQANNLSDVQILHFIALDNKSYTDKRFDSRFGHNALFVGPNTRDATANNTMLCLVTLTTPNGRGFTK